MIIKNILEHPLTQLLSFSILLVGSAYFGGPFIWFIYHAVQEMLLYAIIGSTALVITFVSIFIGGNKRVLIQFIGACLMVLSLLIFFFSSEHFMNMYVYRQVLPVLTLLLFITVVVIVTQKQFTLKK